MRTPRPADHRQQHAADPLDGRYFEDGLAALHGKGRNFSVPDFPERRRPYGVPPTARAQTVSTASTGSVAGKLSMKELTENTARPGPGGP